MSLPPFKRNHLQHALAVTEWMRAHGAGGQMDPLSYELEIACNGRTRQLLPQFVVRNADGSIGFTPRLLPGVLGFVSWLPYFNRVWPIAQDKLAFKEFAQARGVRVPGWGGKPQDVKGPFIVKGQRSTLCRGLRGPFPSGTAVTLADHEYCEQFIVGQLVKAWFWNDTLAVAEVVDMPQVRGNGVHTLRQLIAQRLNPGDAWPAYGDQLAAIQGLSLDAVLPVGRQAIADYRYMSELNPAFTVDHDVRQRIVGTDVEKQLLHAGHEAWMAIPAEIRQDTVFSLDGVLDKDGRVWFLEANCNPQLHPAFYAFMLDGLFSPASVDRSRVRPGDAL